MAAPCTRSHERRIGGENPVVSLVGQCSRAKAQGMQLQGCFGGVQAGRGGRNDAAPARRRGILGRRAGRPHQRGCTGLRGAAYLPRLRWRHVAVARWLAVSSRKLHAAH